MKIFQTSLATFKPIASNTDSLVDPLQSSIPHIHELTLDRDLAHCSHKLLQLSLSVWAFQEKALHLFGQLDETSSWHDIVS